MSTVRRTRNTVTVEMNLAEVSRLVGKLEWASIHDKVGEVYYQLKTVTYDEPVGINFEQRLQGVHDSFK